jgi:acetyl esterase/lipase
MLLFFHFSNAATAQTVIPLYDSFIPNSIPGPDKESGSIDAIKNISKPTLTVFLPSKGKETRGAVIVCPGGGYGTLVLQREGYRIAKAFAGMGIAAFVLKYRLPDSAIMKEQYNGPLQDAQQALKKVRLLASTYKIDTSKIGIIGFSAGGHLAATAGTQFHKVLIENKKRISLRPSFMILVYPVISFSDSLVHTGSMHNLLGASPSATLRKNFSAELQVTDATSPAFLVHAADDIWVPPGNSIMFFNALHRNGVSAELHIYSRGSHGFSTLPPVDEWLGRCFYWLRVNNFILD